MMNPTPGQVAAFHRARADRVARPASRRFAAVLKGVFLAGCAAVLAPAQPLTPAEAREEDVLFTAPGFDRVGRARTLPADETRVRITVRDAATGEPTPCKVNVVGSDGNFYQPPPGRLTPYSLTGQWPAPGAKGNRTGKAPYRYVGRFFYTTGESTVAVPAGDVRVEVWKGLEYRPEVVTVTVPAGSRRDVEVKLARTAPMPAAGYHAGDTHLHFRRETEEDDRIVFDLLEAEGLGYGVTLAYNEPAGPYTAVMDKLEFPQRALGRGAIRQRGGTFIASGQEYRSTVYGHMNLILREDLVAAGTSYHLDTWPVYGEVARETMARGGFALMAHGGYGREIYADAALGRIQSVELLQFGVYRDIGLEGWYNMLNTGYRFPAHAASDYPPCRTLADSRTYVHHAATPTLPEWLAGLAAGRSFFTTAPLLLLEVDGERPGARIRRSGEGPHRVRARVRVRSEITPVTDVDLIVNGRVAHRRQVSRAEGRGSWIELEHTIELAGSAWIAARAHSTSPGGLPDAEAHTNPVYVYLGDRAPFEKAAVDAWIAKIDGQIAFHAARRFPENSRVLNYFQQARDVLLKIRARGGLSAAADPAALAAELGVGAGGTRDLALDGNAAGVADAELRAYLAPSRPTPAAEAVKAFEMIPGFEMQLVAAEPLVRSPIVAAFDENGGLYVGEMLDYPYNPRSRTRVAWQRPFAPDAEPLGTVRLLRDTDGDGVYDQSTVFADKLLWVGGIVPWKGGVYVASPPDIWYLKDTDGDGRADIREKVFTGFAMDRQQTFVNSLLFGLDHAIHGTGGGHGGEIRPAGDPAAAPLGLAGRDFLFSPGSHRLELESGSRQFGMAFDDWGNRFLCDQGNPGFHVVLPLRYLARNPHFTPPATVHPMAPSSEPLHRLSPVERWRHIKSSRRFAGTEQPADIVPLAGAARLEVDRGTMRDRTANEGGVSNHVVDSAAGITVYRGGAYPPAFHGSHFVGDGVANVVHRRVVVPQGATFRTVRGDPGTEFARTPDNWFRPVNFVNAPDGTLYCIDMGREHSESINIPPDVEKHLDLTSGSGRGRIYRMAPAGFRAPPPPRLGSAGTAELVQALDSPHGWWRDTAHRLLFERQDLSAVPALETLARRGSPPARVHALWSLRGLQALTDRAIVVALGDAHPGVRENAIRLAEARLEASGEVREKIMDLVSDPSPRVRLQVAFTIGESRRWNQAALLARIARENLDDPWIQSAVISSASEVAVEVLASLAAGTGEAKGDRAGDFLRRLAVVVGFQNDPVRVGRALGTMATLADAGRAMRLLDGLGEGLRLAGTTLAAADPDGRAGELLRLARAIAVDASLPEASRRPAVEVLGLLPYGEAAPAVGGLLAEGRPASLQQAAIGVLRAFPEPEVAATLVARFAALAPPARTRAIDALLERPDRIEVLLRAIQRGTIPRTQLSAAQGAALRRHGDPRVQELTTEVLGAANPAKRMDVQRAFLPALDLAGSAARGKPLFESRCAVCHRHAGVGSPFGPGLEGVASGGRERLLASIVDPNREVAPEFFLHALDLRDGGNVAGIVKHETGATLTLLQVGGVERTVARANIARRHTQRQSLMPEGLEGGLNLQDMADLIEFVVNPGR